MCGERASEKAATPCITQTIKHGVDSVWGCFFKLQSRGFAPGEEQIESDRQSCILQHYKIPSGTRLVVQRFVLLQANPSKHASKLCQRYIKSKEE